jgi:hypothetical protein
MPRILAWNALQYDPDPGITGFEMAHVRDDSAGCVKFWRIPAGWGLGALGIEENLHFHRRAWEYAAFVDGDFPHVEWDDATQEKRRIRFAPGQLMIRPPTSIHGLHADMTVRDGCDILYWNTGPGTSVLDAGYADETVDVIGDPAVHPFDAADRCRIDDVATFDPSGAPVRSRTMSRAGEPCRVVLHWADAGTDVPLADCMGEHARFLFLWRGRAELRDGPNRTPLPERTTLLPDGASTTGRRLHAETETLWLAVGAGESS